MERSLELLIEHWRDSLGIITDGIAKRNQIEVNNDLFEDTLDRLSDISFDLRRLLEREDK